MIGHKEAQEYDALSFSMKALSDSLKLAWPCLPSKAALFGWPGEMRSKCLRNGHDMTTDSTKSIKIPIVSNRNRFSHAEGSYGLSPNEQNVLKSRSR